MRIRLATWNLKQAVAPRQPVDALWDWLDREAAPDVVVLTEAKLPSAGAPAGWTAVWHEGGIGPTRRWGTVLAARDVDLRAIEQVRTFEGSRPVDEPWPGTVVAGDVSIAGRYLCTVIGVHSPIYDLEGRKTGHGYDSTKAILRHLDPLIGDPKRRVILMGDLNLVPKSLPRRLLDHRGLIELSSHTADQRVPLDRCQGCDQPERCGHLWSHKNGNSPNAVRQQIDYIFVDRRLANSLASYEGGPDRFPNVWSMSDHAPLVATLTFAAT